MADQGIGSAPGVRPSTFGLGGQPVSNPNQIDTGSSGTIVRADTLDLPPAVALTKVPTWPILTKTSALNQDIAVHLLDATGGGFTVTVPSAIGFDGLITLKAITATTNVVTVNTVGGQTVETYASGALTLGSTASTAPYSSVTILSDGANWWIA